MNVLSAPKVELGYFIELFWEYTEIASGRVIVLKCWGKVLKACPVIVPYEVVNVYLSPGEPVG